MSPSPAATVARQRHSAGYADKDETRERARPLRSIIRGNMWSAFPLSYHDSATFLLVQEPLVAHFICLLWVFVAGTPASNKSKQLCAVVLLHSKSGRQN